MIEEFSENHPMSPYPFHDCSTLNYIIPANKHNLKTLTAFFITRDDFFFQDTLLPSIQRCEFVSATTTSNKTKTQLTRSL